MNEEVNKLAKIIWSYHKLDHILSPADCIIVLGSHDLRVARRGAELYTSGYAPLIVCSGGHGRHTLTWDKSEAELFADEAIALGVPENAILVELDSTNTGQNVVYTKHMLESRGIFPKKIIAVHKPFMERRTLATFEKVWPSVKVIVTSPQISFDEYTDQYTDENRLIRALLGNVKRLQEYPDKGFISAHLIPDNVLKAEAELRLLGYTDDMV